MPGDPTAESARTAHTGRLDAAGPLVWRCHARRLAGQLTDAGVVTGSRLREAFAGVPRHWLAGGLLAAPPSVLAAAYGDDALLWDGRVQAGPVVHRRARSAPPSVLARLLGLLDLDALAAGGRVLVTGQHPGNSGVPGDRDDLAYLVALLCHLARHPGRVVVVAADQPEAGLLARRLARLGWRPRIGTDERAAVDGGRFRAVVAGSLSAVEPAWIRALVPGGRIVARWTSPLDVVPICLTRISDSQVSGRLHPDPQSDHWWSPAEPTPHPPSPQRAECTERPGCAPGWCPVPAPRPPAEPGLPSPGPPVGSLPRRRGVVWTEVDPGWLRDAALRRLLALRDPTLHPATTDPSEGDPTSVLIRDTAASWAEITDHTAHALHAVPPPDGADGADGVDGVVRRGVVEGGPRRLWRDLVEPTAHAWRHHGSPGPDRYGLTADLDGHHRVWIDDPHHRLPDPAAPGHHEPTSHNQPTTSSSDVDRDHVR